MAETAHSAEATGTSLPEESQEPPLVPRASSIVSSSQPTFTPPGSETAGAEAEDTGQNPLDVSAKNLPLEASTLESFEDRQEPDLNFHTPTAEAELQTGTAASRGEVLDAPDSSLGPDKAEELNFDAFSLLGPEEFAEPSTDSVGLPPLSTHHHLRQFDSLATDPVFDEEAVDCEDEGVDVDLNDQPEPVVKGEQEVEVEVEETAPSAEASQATPTAADSQPKRTRGARGGQKHQFEQSDRKYAETCDLIASHLASHTYRRTGRAYHLPFVKPLTARKDYYLEWYKYVVHHAEAWADTPDEGQISDEALKAWAAIIPEFWAWCTRDFPEISQGVKQPLYRFPPGYYQKTYKFIRLRQVRSSASASSQAAPSTQPSFPVTVPARSFQPVVGSSAAGSSTG